MHRPTRPGRAGGGRLRRRFVFLMDSRRLPDRIPPERPAARAARPAGSGNLFRLRDTVMIFL
ncbi:hypothetical protein BLAT2472_10963 [Burkholderia latens]